MQFSDEDTSWLRRRSGDSMGSVSSSTRRQKAAQKKAEAARAAQEEAARAMMEEAKLDELAEQVARSRAQQTGGENKAAESAEDAVTVWLVRHSERADSIPGQQMLRQRSLEDKIGSSIDPRDPPLTKNGVDLAAVCGKVLVQSARQAGAEPSVVYSSPLLRCMQTAAEIANAFGVSVQPVASVGACALAVRRAGVENWVQRFYQKNDALRLACPRIGVLDRDDTIESFVQGVERIVQMEVARRLEGEPKRPIVIVTHRESFYGKLLRAKCGFHVPYRVPYCCIGQLEWTPSLSSWVCLEYDVGYSYHEETGERTLELELDSGSAVAS